MSTRLGVMAGVLLLLIALLVEWRVASVVLGSSLAQPDPPAHFVTGVMVYDYLRTALGSNPLQFAQSFYVRYPKVAMGHWPPVFYVVQAGFYFLFGATIVTAQAVSALTAAVLSLLLFRKVRPGTGFEIALAATAVFLASPLMQTMAWEVMSDLLTALLVFLAIMAFSDLLANPGSWPAAMRFAGWSILAILTKGSAWALLPFAVIAPLLAGKLCCFRSSRYWTSGLGIVLLGSPFYLLAQSTGVGYAVYHDVIRSPAASVLLRIFFVRSLLRFAPALMLGFAALGAWDALRARWRRGDDSAWTTGCLAGLAWVVAQGVFLLVLPLTREPRSLAPALAPAAMLMARGFMRTKKALVRVPAFAAVVPAALAGLTMASAGLIPLNRVEGYHEVANAMPYTSEGSLMLVSSMLVSSDSAGEGAIITERLVRDEHHKDVMLRSDKVLAESHWSGNRYRLLLSTAAEVRDYLLEQPVRFVVLDDVTRAEAHQNLLEEAVTYDPKDFHLIARLPISDLHQPRRSEVRIYENPAARTRHPKVVRVPMGPDHGGLVLEYQWPGGVDSHMGVGPIHP